jgi:hypothetical protein
VEKDFVVVGVEKDIGWVWQIVYKTTTYGKVSL